MIQNATTHRSRTDHTSCRRNSSTESLRFGYAISNAIHADETYRARIFIASARVAAKRDISFPSLMSAKREHRGNTTRAERSIDARFGENRLAIFFGRSVFHDAPRSASGLPHATTRVRRRRILVAVRSRARCAAAGGARRARSGGSAGRAWRTWGHTARPGSGRARRPWPRAGNARWIQARRIGARGSAIRVVRGRRVSRATDHHDRQYPERECQPKSNHAVLLRESRSRTAFARAMPARRGDSRPSTQSRAHRVHAVSPSAFMRSRRLQGL